MTPVATDTDWWERAACANKGTGLFFTSNPQRGKAVCARCPVRAECLHDALQSDAPNGIWGGLTAKERRALPALTGRRAADTAALRELLNTPDYNPTPPERTDPPMTTPPAQTEPPVVDVRLKAVPEQTTPELPVDQLLAWGDQHTDPDVQDQAARARIALHGLRQRYTADRELTALETEEEQLARRLAEIRARKGELVPAKTKKAKTTRDYDTAVVRAWARNNGHPCPNRGRIPGKVIDAWRTATSNTARSAAV